MPESKMEELLYDYHLAQGMAQQASSDSVSYYTRLYQQSVYAKYNVDAATFDRSMEWYARHTVRLNKIYERLAERMGDVEGNGAVSRRTVQGVQSASGDTLNLWHGPLFVMLHSQGRNRFQFTERADTAIHQGDALLWKFSAGWHYHEGSRRAVALLIVHYEGDSLAVRQQSLYASGPQMVRMDIGNRKVKQVQGFVYQEAPWVERPRLLTLSDFQLLRVRPHEASSQPLPVSPSGNTLRPVQPVRTLSPDSVAKVDTLPQRGRRTR